MKATSPQEKVQLILNSDLDIDSKKVQIIYYYRHLVDILWHREEKGEMIARAFGNNHSVVVPFRMWALRVATNKDWGFSNAICTLIGAENRLSLACSAFVEFCVGNDGWTSWAEKQYQKLLEEFNAGEEINEERLYSVFTILRTVYCIDPLKSLHDKKFMELHNIYKTITGE